MSSYLDGYIDVINSELSNVEESVLDMVLDQESDIRNMIKSRWLLGKRPDGSIIDVYSDAEYAFFKYENINNLANGNVDLIYNRDLIDGVETILSNNNIEIISIDWKFYHIAIKYGIDNFNITEEETETLLNKIVNELFNLKMNKIWR